MVKHRTSNGAFTEAYVTERLMICKSKALLPTSVRYAASVINTQVQSRLPPTTRHMYILGSRQISIDISNARAGAAMSLQPRCRDRVVGHVGSKNRTAACTSINKRKRNWIMITRHQDAAQTMPVQSDSVLLSRCKDSLMLLKMPAAWDGASAFREETVLRPRERLTIFLDKDAAILCCEAREGPAVAEPVDAMKPKLWHR